MSKREKKEQKDLELARKNTEFNPFGMMRRFSKDMERLFEDFEGLRTSNFFNRDFWPRSEFEKQEWMPQVEIVRNNGQLMVRVDLPGMTKDNVKVEVTDDMLVLSGERNEEKEEKREGYYRTERNYGRFYRQIALPEGVKIDAANATFNNGVLEVTTPAPKLESQARKLEIRETPEKQIRAAA